MLIEPEISTCSIVLVGRFNPAIFHPSWFARLGIVSDNDADEAEVAYVLPEIAAFKLGSINVRVELAKFSAETAEASWVKISDLVIKTFSDFLVHTPTTKIGINRSVHFGVGSEDVRNKIGRLLAPTDVWGEWGARMDAREDRSRAGLINLTMHEPWESDGYTGHIRAQLTPSTIIRANSGIAVATNHEVEYQARHEGDGSEKLMEFLSKKFDDSIKMSDWIIDQVMHLCKEAM